MTSTEHSHAAIMAADLSQRASPRRTWTSEGSDNNGIELLGSVLAEAKIKAQEMGQTH